MVEDRAMFSVESPWPHVHNYTSVGYSYFLTHFLKMGISIYLFNVSERGERNKRHRDPQTDGSHSLMDSQKASNGQDWII